MHQIELLCKCGKFQIYSGVNPDRKKETKAPARHYNSQHIGVFFSSISIITIIWFNVCGKMGTFVEQMGIVVIFVLCSSAGESNDFFTTQNI